MIASFAERSLKLPWLVYRDYFTPILTFRIIKLKIDAYRIFIKVLRKKLSIPSFVKYFAYSAVE